MVVYSRAPMRLSLAGGGTDVDVFAYKYGGCVVSITIARYVRTKMTPGNPPQFYCYPVAQDDTAYLKQLASHFAPVSLDVRVDAPASSGLGASGALGVSILGAINTLKEDEPMSRDEIADMAQETETEMGNIGGRQDQYASVYGGLNYIEFGDHRVHVNRMEIAKETLLALENSMVLVFTQPRDASGAIMANETKLVEENNDKTIEALLKQKELANEIRRVLRKGDLETMGEILDEAWKAKKQQNPLSTTPLIDVIYETAKKAGALGGKVSGSGGGGYMMLFAPGSEGRVAEALRSLGLHPETVTFDFEGLKVWEM